MWHALKGTDYCLDIDVHKILEANHVQEECLKDYFFPPEAQKISPEVILSPMPGGALTANTMILLLGAAAQVGILFLGSIAFSIGTASGILMAKMNLIFETKINPLIGSAGVSAVPMADRVSQKVGMEADPQNILLMHAMGPNVAGVIGSAVAAGVLLTLKHLAM